MRGPSGRIRHLGDDRQGAVAGTGTSISAFRFHTTQAPASNSLLSPRPRPVRSACQAASVSMASFGMPGSPGCGDRDACPKPIESGNSRATGVTEPVTGRVSCCRDGWAARGGGHHDLSTADGGLGPGRCNRCCRQTSCRSRIFNPGSGSGTLKGAWGRSRQPYDRVWI